MQCRLQRWLRGAVAGHEIHSGLGVGEIEAAAPGHEELAPDGGHGIEQRHWHAGRADDFGRHQARRAAPDDGDGEYARVSRHGQPSATRVWRPNHSSPARTMTGVLATAASTHSMRRKSRRSMSGSSAQRSTQGFHTTTSGKPSA